MRRAAVFLLGWAFLPNLAVAEDGYRRLEGHGGPVHAIDFAAGQVVSAGFDNTAIFWRDDALVALDDDNDAALKTILLHDDIVIAAGDAPVVRLWRIEDDVEGLSPLAVLEGHTASVASIAVSAHAGATEMIATASWDGRIGLWGSGGEVPEHLAWLTGHRGPVQDVGFSSDGAVLYSASADGTIRSWDTAGQAFRRTEVENGFGINVIALDDEAGWLAYGAVDGSVRIVDLVSGDVIADFTSERQPVLAMDYHPHAKRLAVGDGEGFIHVIDTENWRTLRDFRATPRGPVWALAFDAEGTHLYTGTLANHIDVWPIDAARSVAEADGPVREFHRDPATMSNGERQFARKCSICHTLTPDGGRRAGPSLHEIFGRRAGTLSNYSYSKALQNIDLVWDEKSLDKLFDIGPDHYTPGSKMPMQRIVRREDRADLIAYLRQATIAQTKEKETER